MNARMMGLYSGIRVYSWTVILLPALNNRGSFGKVPFGQALGSEEGMSNKIVRTITVCMIDVNS